MQARQDGVSVVQGEVSMLLSAMRRGGRWGVHGRSEEEQDPLIHGLYQLQETLNSTRDLTTVDVSVFLRPFCDIVQSDDTTGPVTGMAIASLDKFLAYGLIDPTHASAPSGVENLSEAVTHARFVGTNPASDEVVLMKILQVLHTLLLSPAGRLLSNESVCEIMQSCFRICFEVRLSELLRCFAESTLIDMVQLLFTRLPSFSEDSHTVEDTSSMDQTLTGQTDVGQLETVIEEDNSHEQEVAMESTTADQSENPSKSHDQEGEVTNENTSSDFVSSDVACVAGRHKHGSFTPYGLPCVRELMRFLISITNARDRHNSEPLITIGLELVTVAMECGSTLLCHFPSLASLVQDGLCKNLFSLLRHDSFTLFSQALRCCFLLFQSSTQHLKLQLEMFMNLMMEMVTSDSLRVSFDRQELLLECIVQLCHTPHFTAELYVNFDCGLYCSNLFEKLTKMLSKNAFPTQGLCSTHLLSLDALLAIIHNFGNSHLEDFSAHQEKRFSENPESLHSSLLHGHKLASSSTQINSAGIIFTSSAGQEVEEEVVSSDEQEVTSLPLAAQSDSNLMTSSLLGPPNQGLQSSSSAEALNSECATEESPKNSNVGSKISSSAVFKSPSGYQTAVRMGRGEGVRVEEGVVTLPTAKELLAVRQRKKLVLAATEQFNRKPSLGISFLQEQAILSSPLNPLEVADFLVENPGLSKTMIGECIGDRRNVEVLEAFVRKFSLRGVPLVDALRQFLESFRLPGESPIIARILETFAEHWLLCNSDDLGKVFANRDAVYVLSYAIIMLNTDQHSAQVKKRMTLEEFIRNQRKTNGGQNFPADFLSQVYSKIREEEIIMPAEHSGVVKENYKWKVLLHRSATPEGTFLPVMSAEFDQDLFLLAWGPTVAALSYVFDNAEEKKIVQKAIGGFSKCASVAAHYDLREVFDNLTISLCKFTTLLSLPESPTVVSLTLGQSAKVRQSIQTLFALAHRHGNTLREGWKSILDCLLTLYKAKLLPDSLVEVEDFLRPEGKISLFREETPSARPDSSLLSSLYSYWLLSDSQSASGKTLSPSEIKARKAAMKCVKDCHPEQLFSESKFLRHDSLQELVKSLIFASRGPDAHHSLGTQFDEDSAVFFLELLVSVALENKDRIGLFWSELSNHLARIVVTAHKHRHLLERAVVGLLRLAIRLMSRETLAPQLLSSLRVLLTLPPPTSPHTRDVHRQLANGITELIHSHANTIKTPHNWLTLFSLLEYTGAGLTQYNHGAPGYVAMETSDRSHEPEVGVATIDGEVPDEHVTMETDGPDQLDLNFQVPGLPSDWVWVSETEKAQRPVTSSLNRFDLLVEETLPVHEPQAFFKSCEAMAYLVRSDHYVTVSNFSSCVHCVRTFSEISSSSAALEFDHVHTQQPRKLGSGKRSRKGPSSLLTGPPEERSREKNNSNLTYTTASLQLLDLMDALYSRVGRIFSPEMIAKLHRESKSSHKVEQSDSEISQNHHTESQSENQANASTQNGRPEPCPETDQGKTQVFRTPSSHGLMWHLAWCPLLQGMARMCCDPRRSVRQTAITYLQRALLAHELQSLTGREWEACFLEVFFPMLSRLLETIPTTDLVNLEETRVRASNLLCKVFLQHLPSLSQLHNFTELWLGVLDFMEKYLHLDNSDLLFEAIPESLKNMLLVMSTQGIFHGAINSNQSDHTITLSKEVSSQKLWEVTWNRINQFLPHFLQDLFPNTAPPPLTPSPHPPQQPPSPPTVTVERDIPPDGTAGPSLPIPISRSPSRSPEQSPHASPPNNSPVPESRVPTAEVGQFPVTLHPPLPSVTPPPGNSHTPSQEHKTEKTGQSSSETGQTGFSRTPEPLKEPALLPTSAQGELVTGVQNTVQCSTVYNVKCASVAAHYDLFLSLTTSPSLSASSPPSSPPESPTVVSLTLGQSAKVRQSIQTLFALSHRHGNTLREGWKSILDCLLTLYKAKLLPDSLVEVEDFLRPEGKISLFREETPSARPDSSLLSSLYNYWLLSDSQSASGKTLSPSEIKARKAAMKDRIGLFWSELSNHLARIVVTAHKHRHLLERAVVGLLRLAIRLMSRETLAPQLLSSLRVLLTLPPPTSPHTRDVHRQLANGITELIHSHANTIKTPHNWLTLFSLLEYTGAGLTQYNHGTPGHVAMETSDRSHEPEVGVATVDGEVPDEHVTMETDGPDQSELNFQVPGLPSDWVWVSETEKAQRPVTSSLNRFDLLVEETLPVHEPQAFFKSCEAMAYLVRSDHYVTVYNFSSCVHCVRTFSEISSSSAALEFDHVHTQQPRKLGSGKRSRKGPSSSLLTSPPEERSREKNNSNLTYTTASLQLLDLMDALYSRVGRIFSPEMIAKLHRESKSSHKIEQSDSEISQNHHTESQRENQANASTQNGCPEPCPETDQDKTQVFRTPSSHGLMWHLAWCPLLQGMARMCCDPRRSVRQTAITYLQRALLAHELQSLTGREWEACFLEVFFPMLSRLLETIPTTDLVNLKETRVRASNLLCKVFLQHLPSLSHLHNFTELWLGVLDFMEKYLHLDNSDLLFEAIPESLKNMLLVMSTQGIFHGAINSNQSDHTITLSKEVSSQKLWEVTWNRINQFLPHFLQDLFPNTAPPPLTSSPHLPQQPPSPPTVTVERDTPPDSTAGPSPPIPISRSPSRTPEQSPHASPPSNSPVPESRAPTAEVGHFPVTLHPPLPSVIPPPGNSHTASQEHKTEKTGQSSSETGQTGFSRIPEPLKEPALLPTSAQGELGSSVQNTVQCSTVYNV